jgi:hypothetical protein
MEKGRALEKETVHAAVATRSDSGFEVIWVMWTVLEGVRCGRSVSEVVGRERDWGVGESVLDVLE